MVFVIHRHELAMDLHVLPISIPPPTSLSTPSLWVFPVHQVQALVSCIQPGLVICFTLDNKRHVYPNVHLNFYLSISIPPHLALEYIYHFHFLYKQKDSVWRRILEPKSYRSLWVILIHTKNDFFFICTYKSFRNNFIGLLTTYRPLSLPHPFPMKFY